jgi:arylsulfatase A-like enzyme
MDSLNRHYLPCYGNPWVKTSNIQRLAEKGVVFDSHYAASLPCMPARRDLMNGRYNFLETPWGCLEPYDEALPCALRGSRLAGHAALPGSSTVYSHMITDHYHYWEWHGLGYNCFYNTWEFVRGQEGDNEIPRVRDPEIPACRGKGKFRRQDWVYRSVTNMEDETTYPTTKCFQRAMDFLDHNHAEDNWFLHLEVFDPHEPFVTPQSYRDLYQDVWSKDYHYDWPDYARLDPNLDDAEAVAHIRKQYAATLTMADAWLGRLLDRMDQYNMWDDTTVILTSDHGHLLGEHGYWAKNYMHVYRELANIPLIIAGPGVEQGGRRTALTSAIDLLPTLVELHGQLARPHVHGRSLLPLFAGDGAHHEAVLYGYFNMDVNITDGRYTYCRQPQEGSVCHEHTAMPVRAIFRHRQDWSDTGFYLPHVDMPVYRVPHVSCRHADAPSYHPLYDLEADPGQTCPLHDRAQEQRMAGLLQRMLVQCGAPACQAERLGL